MTAEEVRYPDIYLETPVPAQRKSPEKSERGDPSFGFAEYFTECRRGGASSDARGEGPSTSTSGGAVKLAAQVKELQAKLAERSSELEAIKVPERRRASSTSHHPTPEPRLLVFPRTAR